MNTKKKGDISLSYTIVRLLEEGFDVSVPFSENSRYDLIVD